jgi:hypothetical protein
MVKLATFYLTVIVPGTVCTLSIAYYCACNSVLSPRAYSSSIRHIHRPANMLYKVTKQQKQESLRILFQCATQLLERIGSKPSGKIGSLQKQLLETFKHKLGDTDNSSMSLGLMAHALLFTKEEKDIVIHIAVHLGASDTEKNWFGANIDQANHLIKVLVGGNKSRYPDVDGPTWSC